MSNNQKQPTKAEVQTTPLNKMPVPGMNETGISAEEAAQVFEQNQSADRSSTNQE